MVLLRAHIDVPTLIGRQRQLKWIPSFDRPPPPLWRSGAPIGFEAAAKWASERRLVDIVSGSMAHASSAAQVTGQVRVLEPCLPTVDKRICGKQSGPPARPACVLPVPKPRAVAKPTRLTDDELTCDEQDLLSGVTGVARNQTLKLILHNRSAVEHGRHFIIRGHAANSAGQLKCHDCAMTGRWAEWKFFATVAKCKRLYDGESFTRRTIRERAVAHNRTAAAHGLHVVELLQGYERVQCTACGKVQPQSSRLDAFLASTCRAAAVCSSLLCPLPLAVTSCLFGMVFRGGPAWRLPPTMEPCKTT